MVVLTVVMSLVLRDRQLEPGLQLVPWTNIGLSLTCAALAAIVGVIAYYPTALLGIHTTHTGRSVAFVLLGASTALAFLLRPASPQPTRIAFLNEGGLDWERPHLGEFGDFSGGMFGLLPVYLMKAGFKVNAISIDDVTPERLLDLDVVVIINNPRKWDDKQRRTLRDYMQRGGSTLVLADHTNVFGLRDGLNTLCNDYGIEIRDDSAYPLVRPIDNVAAPALFPAAMQSVRFRLSHGIGASLAIGPTVAPLAQSRYCFSDSADHNNWHGAYLGNYSLDKGEPLGDLTLAAWLPVGEGKFAVYGDTSAFQNSALEETFETHVRPMLCWLSSGVFWWQRCAGQCVSACVLAMLALGAALLGRGSELCLFLSGLVCSAALVLCAYRHDRPGRVQDVIIDNSHMPWTGNYYARMNYCSPLTMALERCGLNTTVCDSFDGEALQHARAFVTIAPRAEYSPSEVSTLLSYMNAGGVVLAVCGREQDGWASLLHGIGEELLPVPLGHLPIQSVDVDRTSPRFVSAWPITAMPLLESIEGRDSLVEAHGQDVAIYRTVGSGGMVVIGDSRFCSTTNTEDSWGAWPGNTRLLTSIIMRYLGGDPEQVVDVWPSPLKPR